MSNSSIALDGIMLNSYEFFLETLRQKLEVDNIAAVSSRKHYREMSRIDGGKIGLPIFGCFIERIAIDRESYGSYNTQTMGFKVLEDKNEDCVYYAHVIPVVLNLVLLCSFDNQLDLLNFINDWIEYNRTLDFVITDNSNSNIIDKLNIQVKPIMDLQPPEDQLDEGLRFEMDVAMEMKTYIGKIYKHPRTKTVKIDIANESKNNIQELTSFSFSLRNEQI